MNENKFNGKGTIYSKFRPSYPRDFIDYLYTEANITEQSVIADIGSGTGILTASLLERGNSVFAVEPNADMRRIAEENLGKIPLFTSIAATAENTTLPDNIVDLITVAQAFHWFDRPAFRKECRRILKPGSRVALVWNSRDESSQFVQENDRIDRKYCPAFKGFSGGVHDPEANEDFRNFFLEGYSKRSFANDLVFDMDSFIGRNLSASYALKEGDAQYETFVAELESLFEKYAANGKAIMPNFTRCYIGQV